MKKLFVIAGLSSLLMVGVAHATEHLATGPTDEVGPVPAGMTTPGNSCSYKFMVEALKSDTDAPKGTNAVTIVGKNNGKILFSSTVCYGQTSKMYTNKPCSNISIHATYVDYPGKQCTNSKGTGQRLSTAVLHQSFDYAETYNLTFTPGSGWL